MRPAVSLLVAIAVLASAGPASAYVHAVTARGCNPVHWAQTCVYLTTDADGFSDMPLADVERIAQSAVESWRGRTDAGSFLRIDYVKATGPREVAQDGWQVIKIRGATWCRPADASGPSVCYDRAATALTTVSYVNDPADPANDGRILDADIELNAVDNAFYDADASKAPSGGARKPLDLWNTLAHELGHLQGLEHTCRGHSSDDIAACARDSAGEALVDCDVVDAQHTTDPRLATMFDATMYPSTQAREIGKRIPKADDVAGVVALYPTSADPMVCTDPDAVKPAAADTAPSTKQGGCAIAPPGTDVGRAPLSLFALFAMCALRFFGPRIRRWR